MSRPARRILPGVLTCLLLLAAPLVFAATPAIAQNGCEGLITPSLTIRGTGRVTSPLGVSLKDRPATGAGGAAEVATLPAGTIFTVLDGPQCTQGYVWWQIQVPSGINGWAAEGNDTDTFLEPTTVGLHTYRRSPDGSTITRFFVAPDGTAQRETIFSVAPIEATPAEAWQQVELDTLTEGLADVAQNCPDRLAGTVWQDESARDGAVDAALPAYDYSFYPSPAGDRLVLVRQLQVTIPRCDTALPERVGMSRVTLLAEDGTEMELFPFPQHGSVPVSQDRYTLSKPDAPRVYMDQVAWSPDGSAIAFVAAYRDTCEDQGCYRFHLYVWNVAGGQLYVPGEGRHVAWVDGGARLLVFRLLTEGEGAQRGHLYSMRPDGTERQEIGLPGSAISVSTTQTDLGFPWNDSGTRVLLGNAGLEQVMVFTLTDRGLTPPIVVPDLVPPLNRFAVDFVRGGEALLWTSLRGQFLLQSVRDGGVQPLASTVARTGVPLRDVRPFETGLHVLIDMADGTAYVLDLTGDSLKQIVFGG